MHTRAFLLALALLGLSNSGSAADVAAADQLQESFDAERKDFAIAFERLKPQLGPAAEGFEWVSYRDVMFLKPQGWNELTRGDYRNSAEGNVFSAKSSAG